MGLLDIPTYEKKDGIIALVLSILLGGLGVLIMGIIKSDKDIMILGAILFVLSFLFGLGWIGAVIWGILVIVKSN